MFYEDVLRAAGAKKIMKKSFFVPLDDILGDLTEKDIERVEFVDCKGNPTQPHVWIPPGKSFRYYNEDDETVIKRKIKNKELPLKIGEEKIEETLQTKAFKTFADEIFREGEVK